MMTNIFSLVAFDIFNLSLVGLGIVGGVALVLAVLFAVLRCQVIYMDTDEGGYEIFREKHPWLKKVKIHSSNKKGKKLVGWSRTPNGKKALTKHKILLTHTIKLYAIWEEAPVYAPVQETSKAATPVKELDYSEGMFVQFNYVDPQTDESMGTEGFRLNAMLPEEQEEQLNIEGWGFAPDGDIVFKKNAQNFVFAINLYPITVLKDMEVENTEGEFNGKSIVELTYIDSQTDKILYKESHYLGLKLPGGFDSDTKFVGWGVEPDGDVVIERGEVDSIFTIQLYSIGEEAAVTEAAPVAEEEPTIEVAPVVEEEPAIEVVEEPVAEEAAPLYEEIVEDYIAPAVVEEVCEAEPVLVDQAPADEKAAPLYKEIVEEYIAPAKAEEPVVEAAPTVEEAAIEVVEEPVQEPVLDEHTPVVVPTYYDNEGNKIDIKYSRSFTANIIQSDDTVKSYYSELKNHILSYKGVKSRISWKFDSYNRGRDQLFKMKLRGKTILLYCALDPNEFDQSKYHHEAIDAKIFEDVPMLVKIKSGLGLRKAKELVDIEMAKFGIEKDEKAKEVDYVKKYPYEPNEPLLARKLIKALEADDSNVVKSNKPKEEVIVPVVPVVEEPVAEPVTEEPVVVEEPAAVEEPVIVPVAEESVEEEPAVEVAQEPEAEPEVEVEPEVYVESVSAEEAHHIVEEMHVDVHVEEDVDYITAKDNKKAIVNIDTLSKAYKANQLVDMKSMKEKKLIDKKAKSVKVLARGILDKPLRIKAAEFSNTAVEMILLTGGQAMHVTYKVKK